MTTYSKNTKPTTADLISAITEFMKSDKSVEDVLKEFNTFDHDFTHAFPALQVIAENGDVEELVKQLSAINLLKLQQLAVIDINEVNNVVYLNSLLSTAVKERYLKNLPPDYDSLKGFKPDWSEGRSFITDIQKSQYDMVKKLMLLGMSQVFKLDKKVDLSNVYPPLVLALIKDSLLHVSANQVLEVNPELDGITTKRVRL